MKLAMTIGMQQCQIAEIVRPTQRFGQGRGDSGGASTDHTGL